MPRSTDRVQNIISRQEHMFRLAERDYGLTIAMLSAETGISKNTMLMWKKDTAMPAYALVMLSAIIPDELTSLMYEPVGKHIGSDGADDDGDIDALARDCSRYTAEYLSADKPRTPQQIANLQDIARRIAGVARRVSHG